MCDQICVNGSEIDQFIFVADVSAKIMSSLLSSQDRESTPNILAQRAIINAESLWDELCKRFKDDSEVDTNE